MAVDIGHEAIDRVTTASAYETFVEMASPASVAGEVTSIDIWAATDMTGLRVGTFYKTNGNTLKCRDSEAIPGTITAGSKVTKVVSLTVAVGDYIGCYFTGGYIERDNLGFGGLWRFDGECIDPGDEETFDPLAYRADSLGGYITAVGWTGKVSGVTNPAKIMGVDVANIKSVKGVE